MRFFLLFIILFVTFLTGFAFALALLTTFMIQRQRY